jgi:selenocysteine-specific elongation factor
MRSIVIGTAGHIDHGKSALVRALTGTDPDRLKEEQARGITIDLGFAHLDEADVRLAFVDVPGHERFVRNMLAGAGGVDAVLLVIAADESVMPQTREHFHICRLLGVRRGVIAISKADLADDDMRAIAMLDALELAAGSFLEGAPVLPVSVRTGEGLDALRAALVGLAGAGGRPTAERPARLPIDRVFSVRGFGTVVTGTLAAGRLGVDDDLVILPEGRAVKVRGLQVHGAPSTRAGPGERVAANLAGVDVAHVRRGDTLAAPGTIEATRRLDASIEMLPDVRPLVHGTRVRVHQGTGDALARVVLAGRTAEIAPGRTAYARLRLESPLVLTRGDRLIVRSYSPVATIAGGLVLDPHPVRGAIRTEAGLERVRRLDPAVSDEATTVRAIVEERGALGASARLLVSRLGLAPAEAAARLADLCRAGAGVAAGGVVVEAGVVERLAARVAEAVDRHHLEQPLSDGLPREEVRGRLFQRSGLAVFETVLERLAASRAIAGRDRLARPGRTVSLTADEARALAALERTMEEAGLEAVDLARAAAAAGVSAADGERLAGLLVRRGVLVRLDTLIFHRDALARLVEDVRAARARGETHVDVASFKARFGLSRKYAIPLLEFLDRERVTRRVGDRRLIL